jgi:uncharacterized membrane protein required for colicin V production
MSWVDLVIVVLVVLAALRGFFEGAIRQVASLIGLGVGFLLGVWIAPALSTRITHAAWRPLLALIIIMLLAGIGSALGGFVGAMVAKIAHAMMLGMIDRVAGVVVGVVATLIFCWLVAGVLTTVTWGSVASQIQGSSILKAMDGVMPAVPAIETKVQSLFPNASLPSIFSRIVAPTLQPPVKPETLGPLTRSLAGPTDVVKVLASGGCTGISEGTAFYVAPHELLTNAHVVAGHTNVTVNGQAVQVAYFDPDADLAVLRDATAGAPLHFLKHAPVAKSAIKVIGFPLDGTRTGAPGFVEGQLVGQGRDIYGQKLLTKTVLALEVNIQPGNSGSPVLAGQSVAGIVESLSLSQKSTAYAIPDSFITADLAKVPAHGSVSTQSCLS